MASYIIGGIVIAGFVVMTCVVLCPVIATAAAMSVSAGSGASILAAAKVTGAALTDQPNTSIIKPARKAGAGGGRIAFGPASEDAWKVLNRVDARGSSLPGYKGGAAWANDGSQGAQILPRGTSGGDPIRYQEWDLSPKVKGVPRDASRLLTGSDGSAHHTSNHYESFILFRSGG